ncbi:low molecular weight protein-tyrosine-phosphatase [Streptococcus panodentis]|uniref:protein-tyrosine-phosphatase n=1 Tax=Streptococcus panodentis TaxID=1581472 RepID=A0ABS5AWP5_9STRE|nr:MULTISPECIES: low molecular weight protein-tyrosine-phosphatase [Streptococcus]KXT77535.1 Low molecular weight protein tyrosine phosphatase [Streptococcus sp. DD11]MBP2620997.1 phosphotyrosine protein phosphatase [Streptococcus panodentis]
MKKIVFVCLGNICRSPMAEFVMKSLTDSLKIESRATSDWEHGNPIHQGTQAIFRKYGIAYDRGKTSQQISARDFADFDCIIGMDEANIRDLKRMAPAEYQDKICQFGESGVPDPWYTGDFDETYELVLAGCRQWLERLNG